MEAPRRHRLAVGAAFATHGVAAGSWAARVPWAQDRLHLSAGLLGLALVTPAVGAVLSLPVSGAWVSRSGSRRVTRIALAGMCLSVGLLTAVPALPWLAAALFAFGGFGAVTDVAMNANAVAVEARRGRPIMSGLHAVWSVGALAGGAIGGAVAHAGVGAPVHLGVAAVVLVLAGSRATTGLLEVPPHASAGVSPARLARPTRATLPLGLLALAAMFAEGAGTDWSAVFAHRVDGVDAGTAASAFTAFASAMIAGRLLGNRVTAAYGPVRVVRSGGLVAAAGCALVATTHLLPATVAGFALLGLGLAVAVPLAFGAAGHHGAGGSGSAIASVATLGYLGGTAAPAAIGGIAELTSLPTAFVVVAAVTLAVSALAPALGGTPAQAGDRPREVARFRAM